MLRCVVVQISAEIIHFTSEYQQADSVCSLLLPVGMKVNATESKASPYLDAVSAVAS